MRHGSPPIFDFSSYEHWDKCVSRDDTPIIGTRSERMRYSGLQREVLALYRRCLRESRKRPVVSALKADFDGCGF